MHLSITSCSHPKLGLSYSRSLYYEALLQPYRFRLSGTESSLGPGGGMSLATSTRAGHNTHPVLLGG